MAHSREHYEFDLSQGDKLVIGDLILTIHDIASSETCMLVEAAHGSDCDINSPLAQVICD